MVERTLKEEKQNLDRYKETRRSKIEKYKGRSKTKQIQKSQGTMEKREKRDS